MTFLIRSHTIESVKLLLLYRNLNAGSHSFGWEVPWFQVDLISSTIEVPCPSRILASKKLAGDRGF